MTTRLARCLLAAGLILPALVFSTSAQHVFDSARDLGLLLFAPLALLSLLPFYRSLPQSENENHSRVFLILALLLAWQALTGALAFRKDLAFQSFVQLLCYASGFLAAFYLSAHSKQRRFLIIGILLLLLSWVFN